MIPFMGSIIQNEQIADRIYRIVIENTTINEKNQKQMIPKPGQFYYIRVNDTTDPLLRRPISIQDFDGKRNHIKMLYRTEGIGTTQISQKKIGEKLDVLGPLGNGFTIEDAEENGSVLLLGGGIGIPPLYYLKKELVAKKVQVTTLLGYQTLSDSFLIDEFKALGETRVASMDGSIGIKGTVLQLISELEKWDTFYAVGPTGMLKAIQQKWGDTAINGYVSLEERMGCGVGACYGCIVKVDPSIDKKGYKKVCSDGPVFSFREVIL